jgi:proteic killer suppression protein
MVLHVAPGLETLMLNPGNKFHALSGNRKGQYAISINKQWRVCFEWEDGNAYRMHAQNIEKFFLIKLSKICHTFGKR